MPRRLLPLLVLLLACAVPAAADSLLTLKSHVDAFQVAGESQPAKDTDVRIWVGADKLRRDEGEVTSILRLDRNKLYVIRHADKTWSELTLPVDFVRLMPKGSEQAGAVWAQQMKLTVQVEPSGETRTVGTWNAKKLRMDITNATGMKIASTLWLSKDVPDWSALNRLASTLAALQPGSGSWVSALEKLDGFPVLREEKVEAMGARFNTREELVTVETRDATPGTYEPPAGYKQAPFNPLEGVGG
ncbi:MAG TPA: DUF4412 domain-containing protein [Thermoanaerobaculia bacterium]|nr:DUF4412 domain-containing protein [Thermoanaerobaculia bacterium]